MDTYNDYQLEKDFSEKLFKLRTSPCCSVPVKSKVERFVFDLLRILFPHYSEKVYHSSREIEADLIIQRGKLERMLQPLYMDIPMKAANLAHDFFEQLPCVHEHLRHDADSIFEGDPAAENRDEVILAYPGFFAIAIYRLANILYSLKVPILPRLFTEYAHQRTGIDINPGAKIGSNFCIDHGTGIVIGETCEIGDNVKIYQGVTLGALSVDKDLANKKRHPTIEDNVVIYSGATILGGNTTIGHDSIIGGNVWLTESVQPFTVVYHKSQIKLRNSKNDIPEPINFII